MPLDAATVPDFRHSACPHDCPSTCALEVERLSASRIGRVRGAKGHPYTAGVICAKVARYGERVHHPERLTAPLRRVGDQGVGAAAFEQISWDAALDTVAEAFLKAEQRHGAETVWPYYYAGTMGLVMRDGIERLRHAKGYSRQHSTFCVTLGDAGLLAGLGARRGSDSGEIAKADLVVIWGGNPVHTHVNVMHHAMRARKQRGAKLVVVDPYRTATAEQADLHLMVKPGTDGALACAVINVILAEGLADRDYLARFTDWDRELEEHFAQRTPEWAAEITGVPAAQIVEFARLFGGTKRAFIRAAHGFSRQRNGSMNMHAVLCLPSVTGAWAVEGGGALYANTAVFPLDKTLIEGLDRVDKSVRLLDQSRIGPILCGDPRDLGEGPPVTALLVQSTNPMMVAPETNRVRQGFARPDLFACVHEQFLTETAAMADIVLPATTFLEHDDLYMASGHNTLQVVRKVIEPLAEARSNHFVICELAKRLGAEHAGFGMSAWELIEATLEASGLPDAATIHDAQWWDCAPSDDEMHFRNGFPHADGRFHFKPDWSSVGSDFEDLPRLPGHHDVIDSADAERPFRLVTAPSRNYLNSSFTETPTSRAREGRPTVKIHPQACARLGVADGGRLRLGNDRGTVVVHAEAFDGLQPEVVVVEGLWPNAAFEEGIGINALTSAEPGRPRGGAVFHDTAIWIHPA